MRRKILPLIIAVAIFSGCQKDQPASESLTTHVNPLIGTSAHGHTFPGATVPFGMVQLRVEGGTLEFQMGNKPGMVFSME